MRTHRLLTTAFLLALVVGCGSGGGTPPVSPYLVSQAVGPAGGVVEIPGTKLAVEIPPGALADTETITVARASDAPPSAVGRAYELGPDGLAFAASAVLRYEAAPGDLPADGLPEDLRVLTLDGSEWVEVDGWFPDPNGVSAEIDHFSRYVIVNLDGAGIFHGTFGFASDEIYAFGRDVDLDGTIVRWDGEDADPVETLTGGRYYDGWGASATRLYAVGYDGQGVIRLTTDRGQSWTEDHRSGAGVPLFAVHGAGDLVVAVGRTILEKDETNAAAGWSDVSAGGLQLADVVVFADGSAIAVGVDTVLGRDASDGSWSSMAPLGVFSGRYDLRAVWARGPSEVYVAGYGTVNGTRGPVVLKYDGTTWTLEPIVAWAGRMEGIGGDGTHVVAVGRSGMMQVLDGTWSVEDLERTEDLLDVWVIDLDHLALVGTRGLASFPGLVEPPAGPVDDRILLSRSDNLIASIEPDGSDLVVVPSPLDPNDFACFGAFPAAWSPDHLSIVFVKACEGDPPGENLHTMDADGSTVEALTDMSNFLSDDIEMPAWSPDGTRVVYVGSNGLQVIDVSTGAVTVLADEGHGPTWSPDSETIAFARRGDIHVVPADGSASSQAIVSSGTDWEPSWQNDGTLIAFRRGGGVFTVDSVSHTVSELVPAGPGFPIQDLDWSPDDSKLVVVRLQLSNLTHSVHVIDVSSGQDTKIHDSPLANVLVVDW